MTILIPEVENSSYFPDDVLEELFAWAEKPLICLYCNKPVRVEEDEETPAESFEGFDDFMPHGALWQLGSNLSAETLIFLRDPEGLEHSYYVGK